MKKLVAVALAGACVLAGMSVFAQYGYVDDGLVAHWDAIDNQATGTHVDGAATWIDLVGNSRIDLKDVTWEDDALYFPGSVMSGGVFADNSVVDHRTSGLTIEVVARIEDTGTYAALFSGPTYDAAGGTGYAAANSPVIIRHTDKSYFYTRSVNECGMTPALGDGFGTATVNWSTGAWLDGTHVYLNGEKANKPSGAKKPSFTIYDSHAYLGRLASTGVGALKGRIYSVRVYKRALSAAEALQNYTADVARFSRLATVRAGSVTVGGTTYGVGEAIIGAGGDSALAIESAADAQIELGPLAASLSVGAGTLTLVSGRRVDLESLTLGDGASLTLPAGGLLVKGEASGANATVKGPGRFIVCTAEPASPIPLADGAVFLSPYQAWTGWPDSGIAYVPMGTAATVPDAATAAKVAGLDGIVFLDDAGLNVGALPSVTYSLGDALTFSTPVEWNGTVRFESCGKVTLSGNNAKLTGQFFFTNTDCTVTHEYGLGSKTSGRVYFWRGNDKTLLFDSEAAVITNHVDLFIYALSGKHYAFGSASPETKLVQDGEVYFGLPVYQQQHSFSFYNAVDILGAFKFVLASGTSGSQYLTVKHASSPNSGVVGFYGAFLGTGGYFYWNAGDRWDIGCPISNSDCQFLPSPNATFNCLAPNVFAPLYNWRPNQDGAIIVMNGFDQVINGFRYLSGNASTQTGVTGKSMLTVTSEDPATMSLLGSESKAVQMSVQGAAGLCMAGSGAYTFYNLFGDTTGELSVKSGKLTLDSGCYWNGTNVTVRGGELVLVSVNAVPTGKANLLVTGGSLTVKAGAAASFFSGTFGSGEDAVTLADGTYTMAQLRATDGVRDFIGDDADDEATITVDSTYEGPWTGWPEEGGEVRIPKGATVVVAAEDFGRIAKVTALSIGNNATLTYSGFAAEEMPYNFPVSGSGRIEFKDISGTVVITADNSGLVAPGGFTFEQTDVVVSNRYGLGSAQTGECRFTSATGNPDPPINAMTFMGTGLTNDVDLTFYNAFTLSYNDTSVTSSWPLVQNGDLSMVGGATVQYRGYLPKGAVFNGDVKGDYFNLAGKFEYHGTMSSSGTGNTMWNFGTSATVDFYGPEGMSTSIQTWQWGYTLNFHAPYQLKTTSTFGSYDHATFELNGFNQQIGSLAGVNGMTDASTGIVVFNSETPAEMRFANAAGASTAYRCTANFTGAASLRYAGTAKQYLGRGPNATTGDLTVESGRLEFTYGAAWGGTNVVVSGGTLAIAASASTNKVTGAGTFFNRKALLQVSGAGAVDIAAGRTETVKCYSIDGVWQPKGDYTLGSGTLRVRRSDPNEGILILVR